MKVISFFIAHLILFFLILLVMMSFQGAVWLQLFTGFPSPCLWLTFIVYGAFYRSLPEAILLTYLTSVVAAPFVNIPIGLMICCNCSIMLILLIFKSRFMVSKPIYLSLLTLFVTLIFPVTHYTLSLLMENNPIQSFELISWFISAVLTAIFSVSLYQFYVWFDRFMNKAWPSELGRY